MASPNNFNKGLFVPTTNIWDVSQLEDVDVNSIEFRELLVRLYQNLSFMSTVLNLKDGGYYDLTEFVTGQIYFPLAGTTQYRPTFRMVVNFGALPNAGTKSVPHNIPMNINGFVGNPAYTFTRIYATASDTTNFQYIPIPYAAVTGVADNIELLVDNTNVNITTGANYSSFTVCYVVLEYIKT